MIAEQEVWDALPPRGFVRSYVEYAQGTTDANIAYHVAGALSILTQTVPIDYCVPYASPLWGTMYSLLVGDSSKSRKTAAINVAQRVLREAVPGSVGEIPGSQEGLYESLRAQQRQLIVYGEFGEFLAKSEQGYMMPLKTTLTNLWDCLDSETEILTTTGWKGRGEVKIGDFCYSLDTETGKLEITPVLDVGERPVREGEKMFVLKGQRSDIRTTEGHRFYIKYRNNGKLSEKFLVKTGKELTERKSEYILPLAALTEFDTQIGSSLTHDELRFVAWFMTDGGFAGPNKVCISQSKPEMVEEIRSLLIRLGFDFRESVVEPGDGAYANSRANHRFVIPKGTHSGSMARNGWGYLSEYLDKNVSPKLHTMNRNQFMVFWKEALKGDGDNTKAGLESDGLYCNLKTQANAYSHMAAARGFAVTISERVTKNGVAMYRVCVRDNQWLHTVPTMEKAQKPRLEDPKPGEIVWCVSNKNQTIVTRRNGKVAIIGNCIPIGRALANNRRGAVQDPRLSLLCGVAPALLERHTETADWTGGFLARFLTFYAEPERQFPTQPIDDYNKRNSIVQWIKNLSAPQNAPGRCLWLDDHGSQMWADWWEHLQRSRDSANERVAAACSRSTSVAAKTALLLAWDIGQARSGQDWYVGEAELRSALAIANLHLDSVIELGESVTGSKDMRDRRSVLRAIGLAPTPLGVIINKSQMLKRRVMEIIDSLSEERSIKRETVNGQVCYVRTPDEHQALVEMLRSQEAAFAANVGGTVPNVVAFKPKLTPLVPEAEQINEEDYWATYQGDE